MNFLPAAGSGGVEPETTNPFTKILEEVKNESLFYIFLHSIKVKLPIRTVISWLLFARLDLEGRRSRWRYNEG